MREPAGGSLEVRVQIVLRLFGLGTKHAGKVSRTRSVEPGTTVQALWESLRAEAAAEERMAVIDPSALLVLVNGHPIHLLDGWETRIAENDTVTYMPKAFGG